MSALIDRHGAMDAARPIPSRGPAGARLGRDVIRRISRRGRAESEMVLAILRAAARKPAVLPTVFHFLGRYEQARRVLDHAATRVREAPHPRVAVG
jgi:hypothetical protein